MLKSASVGFRDIWRVETIKDRRIQVMPPHGNQNHTLREMDTLLQEMRHLNAGHAPGRLEFGWSSITTAKDALVGDSEWDALTKANAVEGEKKHKAIIFNTLCDIAGKVHGWPKESVTALKASLKGNTNTSTILKSHMTDIEMNYAPPTAPANPAATG